MHLIRVGRRVINVEYLICAEGISEGGHEILRVTLETGKEFDLMGHEAKRFDAELNELLAPAKSLGPLGAGAYTLGPAGGESVVEPPARQRKKRR